MGWTWCRRCLAAVLAVSIVLVGVPAETFADAVGVSSEGGASPTRETDSEFSTLDARAHEVASELPSGEEGLAKLWDMLMAAELVEGDADMTDADVTDAALAALDGQPSTKPGVVRAFVFVARELGFDAEEVVDEGSDRLARIEANGAFIDLDIANGEPGVYPWLNSSVDEEGKQEEGSGSEPAPVDEGLVDEQLADEQLADEAPVDEGAVAERPADKGLANEGPAAVENAEDVARSPEAEVAAEEACASEASSGENAAPAKTPSKKSSEEAAARDEGAAPAASQAAPAKKEPASSACGKASAPKANAGLSAQATAKQSIANASVSSIANQAYTGKAITPSPTVKIKSKVLKNKTDYTLSYKNNVKAGTATVTITGKGSYTGTRRVIFKIVAPSVQYYVHRQTYGWEGAWSKANGAASGTTGQSKRLEGIKVRLNKKPVAGSIQYRTHIQTYGWESGWKKDGAMSGTSGQSKRLEAIQMKLTGSMASRYSVWYRVHAQVFGWMGWAKDGVSAGTAGYSRRLEAIQIVVLPKGEKPAATFKGVKQNTSSAFREVRENPMTVTARSWTISASKVKSYNYRFAYAPVTVKNAKGTVTRRKAGGSKYLLYNTADGSLSVAKGTPVGTHTIQIAVTASGDSVYKPATKTVTVRVTVKANSGNDGGSDGSSAGRVEVRCTYCGGTGDCETCDGTGWILRGDEMCEVCLGSGDCHYCEGKGYYYTVNGRRVY